MSSFTTPIDGRWLDGERWMLLAAFEYHVGGYPSPDVIVSPAGFVTDFASIPKPLRLIWSPTGRLLAKPSVTHDFGYAIGEHDYRLEDGRIVRGRSRLEWDRVFAEGIGVMLEVLEAGWWDRLRARPIYPGVRIGGRRAWNRHRRLQAEAHAAGRLYPELLPLTARLLAEGAELG